MSWFRLKACPKCRGDLASDEGDWICLQCGTYYYTGLYDYTGLSRTMYPNSVPEDGGPSNGPLTSQTEQRGRSAPDNPPRRQGKTLNQGLGAAPTVPATTDILIPSVGLAINLALRQ